MKFSETIANRHFKQFAAMIRRVTWSPSWRERHPQVAVWSLVDEVADTMRLPFDKNRDTILAALVKLFVQITEADPSLGYTQEDMAWLVSVLDSEDAQPIVWMLLAYGSAPSEFVTPAEAAEITDTSESGWRNRAAAGDIPGAIKKGKQWLIPLSEVSRDA